MPEWYRGVVGRVDDRRRGATSGGSGVASTVPALTVPARTALRRIVLSGITTRSGITTLSRITIGRTFR